jgi:phenylacetate-CoA ligase
LLEALAPNPFYREKLAGSGAPWRIGSAEEFAVKIPFTTKADLVEDCLRHPPFGSNQTAPRAAYCRFCQSSGTSAGPLPTLDTPESWGAMLDVWDKVFHHAGVVNGDVFFFAFSFGPFLGFWTAFEAATRRGHLSIPGGGMGSRVRLEMMARYGATVLCCTPTYALRLGEVLEADAPQLRAQLRVRLILVAGEPGGSIPETRTRISQLWNGAEVRDHHGMTETGPVSYETKNRPGGLLVDPEAFHAEIIDAATGRPAEEGAMGELVLTTLRRIDRPLLRYRTGDLVKAVREEGALRLEGGILGRSDDMLVVRGVNVYPSALEAVLRRFPEVAEFQVRHRTANAMTELEVVVESAEAELADRIQVALANAFALRIPVHITAPGTLPRPEFKSQRWIPG